MAEADPAATEVGLAIGGDGQMAVADYAAPAGPVHMGQSTMDQFTSVRVVGGCADPGVPEWAQDLFS